MKDIISIIESIPNCYTGKKVSKEMIDKAEKQLDLKFSNSYKLFLEEYGSVSFSDIELAGLSTDVDNDVVNLTNRLRKIDNKIGKDYYVIENVGIDKVMMLSNSKDEVFMYHNGKIVKKHDSFEDYLKSCIKN